ncbi:uncharacterized protein LOC143903513 [Temnothorax americanus]|uniref:uncharacterized protein LOC143903513 n=1 Tax=Temnothorax americanus TaxID=1964332 RepID=UPI004067ABA0
MIRTPPSETETPTGTGTGDMDIDELRRTLAHQQQVIQQLQQSQSSRPPSSGMAIINEGTLECTGNLSKINGFSAYRNASFAKKGNDDRRTGADSYRNANT